MRCIESSLLAGGTLAGDYPPNRNGLMNNASVYVLYTLSYGKD